MRYHHPPNRDAPTDERDGRDERATRTVGRDRGISEVIGAILLFGLLIIVLTLIQANAVPDANKQLEFQHNERVHADFVDLDADVETTAATGNGRVTVVETGLRYPPRFFLFNPPPATGSIRTEASRFTIRNAVAEGETGDYWNGDAALADSGERFVYDSRTVRYTPAYNVYAGAPNTSYTHGAVVNRFEGAVRPVDDAAFLNGRTVSLVALDGDRDVSQVEPISLETTPLATNTRTVRVTDDGTNPIVITIRTSLAASTWSDLLSGEPNVVAVRDAAGEDAVEVELRQGVTYELRLAKVGVGPGADVPAAAYMTSDTESGVALETNQSSPLTIEVRDAFNGPVAGQEVTFEAQDGRIITESGAVDTTTGITNEQGRATVEFVPERNGDPTLIGRADLNGDTDMSDPEERVEISVVPRGAGSDDFTLNPIGSTTVLQFESARVLSTGSGANRVDVIEVEFNNTADTAIPVEAMRMNFYFRGSPGNPSSGPPEPETAILRSLNNEELTIRGGFEPVDWTVEPDGDTLTIEFTGPPRNGNNNYDVSELDFFVLTIEYPDGRVSSYIISPEEP